MPLGFWVPVTIAAGFTAIMLPLTWSLIWPAYKRIGKPVFFLSASLALAWFFGWWSLLFIVPHQLFGLCFHIWWCRKHHLSVWRPDPEAYRETQKAWVDSMKKRAEG